jgi:tRNA threonylcarbamoyladenosine biosynthesis protein TsaB
MKVTIFIDTSNNKEVTVVLKMDEKEFVSKQLLNHRKAQVVLPLVENLLKEHKLELKDLTDIEVNVGPGSFTGIRVGISIANALGYLLKIPVNGKPVGELVEAVYT